LMTSICSSPSPLAGQRDTSMMFNGQIHFSYYTGFYPHIQAVKKIPYPYFIMVIG
jgi:hypothetical protein